MGHNAERHRPRAILGRFRRSAIAAATMKMGTVGRNLRSERKMAHPGWRALANYIEAQHNPRHCRTDARRTRRSTKQSGFPFGHLTEESFGAGSTIGLL